MKKLLATTAIAMIAMASAASAQSVLERVLTSLDSSTTTALNGTFANIAENIGGAGSVQTNLYANSGTVLTQSEYDALVADNTVTNTYFPGDNAPGGTSDTYFNTATGSVLTEAQHAALSVGEAAQYTLLTTGRNLTVTASGNLTDNANIAARDTQITSGANLIAAVLATKEVVSVASVGEGVNGSINNAIEGITASIVTASQVATAGTTVAYQFDLPTYDLGELSTTALGAVNTGTITLGVNSTVDDAKTSSTQAVSSVMAQLGGSANTGAIVLNVASNMTGVNGSINNTMNNVNGAMLKASTTALGAVNTGIITSGVNAAVAGIVGTSGQTNGIAP